MRAWLNARRPYRYRKDGLIEGLREPGIELPKVFRRVSAQVAEASHEAQVPSVLGNWPAEDLPLSQK